MMRSEQRPRRIVSIILAAGRGTRMRAPDRPKVCFSVDGQPVIARAVETYHRCGVTSHFLVVGPGAEQVMHSAAQAPGHHYFCFQVEQRGTGHATRTAANLLRAMDYQDDVLVVAGDKVIEDAVLHRLMERFYQSGCDLAFVVGDVRDNPSSGRVVYREDGRVLGIVETPDIARAQLLHELSCITRERALSAEEVRSLALAYLKQEKKAALALGALWDAAMHGQTLTRRLLADHFSERDLTLSVNGTTLSPERLAEVRHANLSVYLFRAPALYAALDRLSADNAQQEEYLTDTVGILAAGQGHVRTVPVIHRDEVMAFNTPEELQEIEARLRARRHAAVSEAPRSIRRATQWLECFASGDSAARRWLAGIYGEGSPNIEERRRRVVALLQAYLNRCGDDEVVITRAPGRVNIMGRHVDHQGGHVNTIAMDRDIFMVIGARPDRRVLLHNLESHLFPDRSFDLGEALSGCRGRSWREFVDSGPVRAQAEACRGDWVQYARAAAARLQVHFRDHRLPGMNVIAAGNVPVAAGLSSSSAVVVAMAEGILALNGLQLPPERFVDLCGEGEWYVGTRGGAGDHAAMKFARRGHVVQMGFFPFRVTDTVPFPSGYRILVCNSHQKARKTAGAKDTFNHRVACYQLGRELLKQAYPEHAGAIEHLRDIRAERLGISPAQLLEMLRHLPVSMTRREVLSRLPEERALPYLQTHAESAGDYPLRAVVMFGLAECERSRGCAELLRQGDISSFGQWMKISHDGDRVVRWEGVEAERAQASIADPVQALPRPFAPDYSDDAMDSLIALAQAGHADASLAQQPGGYACSTPEIDRMVDIALSVQGVLGAQIAGAGLGGCIMALVREDACADLEDALIHRFYEPCRLEPEMFACYPVAGSGAARW